MTHVSPNEHHEHRLSTWRKTGSVEKPDIEVGETNVRRLYGPKGEILRSFSDKPPTGFHQGERGKDRQ